MIVNLAKKRILVTGASSGLGAHMARTMARQGAYVAVAARRADALQALAEGESGGGAGPILPIEMDVRDPASVSHGVAQAAERMGGLDGVANNAGISWGGRTLDMAEEDWATGHRRKPERGLSRGERERTIDGHDGRWRDPEHGIDPGIRHRAWPGGLFGIQSSGGAFDPKPGAGMGAPRHSR